MTNQLRPTKPCNFCESTSFAIFDEVSIEIACEMKRGFGNNVRPMFKIIVCKGCSKTEFFMKGTEEHLLLTCEHEPVDLKSKSPYR